jgi:hypothetical protein
MGELVKQSTTAQWLVSIEQSRSELIEAAKTGNKIATAFAMAEARVRLIESLDNEEVKARLLRMTDPRIGMVELANNPTEEDRIRVCAIAILSGFCPGEDQFAVFGGKGTAGGKLYTKEAGFRTLFAHLGIVPEVQTGHPEFVPLGTSGKKVWRVGGKASCEYGGKSYSVDFSGPAALGISGYETDNVAGIAAKARRRMLQALWAKVSPILTQDQADDVDVIPEAPLPAIGNVEAEPARPDTEEPSDERKVQKAGFDGWHKAAQTRVTNTAQLATINEYWSEIANATNKDQLRLLHQDLTKNQVKPLGKNNVDELCRWCAWNAEVLP